MVNQAIVLAFAALAVAAPAPEPSAIHIPLDGERLAPRADGTVNIAAVLKHVNYTLAKYHSPTLLGPLSKYGVLDEALGDILKERAVANERLIDQANDLLYYGNIQVGAAKQKFTTDFDTGSSDLFVPGPNCPSCKGTPYNQQGTARKAKTSVTYGSGQVSGNDYFDTVCVAGLCADKTNLISLTDSSGFSASKSSSLMGMGFSQIAASKKPTFFENLISQGKVNKPEFSFYLGRHKSGTGPDSQMTLGGVDTSKFKGKQESHKVTKQGYWQLKVDGAAVSGSLLPALLTAGQAAIDTGTTVVIAPTVAASGISAALGAVPVPVAATGSATETAFAYQCDTKQVVSLIFGGKKYEINPLDLNLGRITPSIAKGLGVPAAGGLCFSSIIAADLMPGQEFYVVGDTFLKNWHSTYSFAKGGSVSFAKAV